MMEKGVLEVLMAKAAAGEGAAYTTYTIFAEKLREDGHYEAAMRLEELAGNEKEHMEVWLKRLSQLSSSMDMLQQVIHMEHHDADVMYANFGALLYQSSTEDVPSDLPKVVESLKKIETRHVEIIEELLSEYEGIQDKQRPNQPIWVCPHCGNFYYSKEEIPEKCPVCEHDGSEYVFSER